MEHCFGRDAVDYDFNILIESYEAEVASGVCQNPTKISLITTVPDRALSFIY